MSSITNTSTSIANGIAYGVYIVAAPLTMVIGLVRSAVAAVFYGICYGREKIADTKAGAVLDDERDAWRSCWTAELKRGAMELLPFIGAAYWTYRDYHEKEAFGTPPAGLLGLKRFMISIERYK